MVSGAFSAYSLVLHLITLVLNHQRGGGTENASPLFLSDTVAIKDMMTSNSQIAGDHVIIIYSF